MSVSEPLRRSRRLAGLEPIIYAERERQADKFIGNPTAALIKECCPKKYNPRYWVKYEKWLNEWREYNIRQYDVEYWSMKYHQCCVADMNLEFSCGIAPYCEESLKIKLKIKLK